jgi:chloride channel 3/4/5
MKIATWRKNSIARKYPVLEVLIVTVITALINYPIIFMRFVFSSIHTYHPHSLTHFIRPQSSELVANLFQECSPKTEDIFGLCHVGHNTKPIFLLLLSAVFGALLASATFGLQIPAGIILPSMAIGALYGRAMGLVLQSWQHTFPNAWMFSSCEPDIECVTPGTFAIIGAASALGGVTRMTVSIVVITFELTGALTYVLPIMVAVMISKWVGDAFGKRGIYESWIRFKEYPFLDNRDDYYAPQDVPVADIMTRIEDLVVITETGHTVDSLRDILQNQPYKGFPVVSDVRDAKLVGYISRSELRFALEQARHRSGGDAECWFSPSPAARDDDGIVDMRPWMDHTPITLPSNSSLSLATNLFQKLGLRYVLFAKHGTLQGLLTKKDVFFVMNASEEAGDDGVLRGRAAEGRSLDGGRRDEARRLLGDEGSVGSLSMDEDPGSAGGLLGSM